MESKVEIAKADKCPQCKISFADGLNCCLRCNITVCFHCGKENKYKKVVTPIKLAIYVVTFPVVVVGLLIVLLVSPEAGFVFPWRWLDTAKCQHCGRRYKVKCVD